MVATNTVPVAPSNTEQLRAWDGDEGAYWVANSDYFDRSLILHHQKLLAAAAIADDERVLDIGCGTGQTTRDAARAAASGSALGVDLSSKMIDYARRRAADEGVTNVFFEQADAQIHPFEAGSFDIAISRTGAMFFGDAMAGFTNVGRALRAGGRLAILTWQPLSENEWVQEVTGALAAGRDLPGPPPPDAPSPFSLSDPDRVRRVLTGAGFADVELNGVRAGMWFGADADDTSRFVLGLMGWMLADLDDAGRARAADALHATATAHETPSGVVFDSAAWIIRAIRR
jgi:SAM-dependent methyltransferase